jgi:hypothetical protein
LVGRVVVVVFSFSFSLSAAGVLCFYQVSNKQTSWELELWMDTNGAPKMWCGVVWCGRNKEFNSAPTQELFIISDR